MLRCARDTRRLSHALLDERPRPQFVDRGAQFVASGYRNLHALALTLGIADRVRPVRRASNAILRDGVLHPGDYGSLGAFARSRLLSARAKLRLARLLVDLVRQRGVLDPLRPERAAALDRDDMGTYLRRSVGEEAFEYLLAPAFSSTFDSDPEDIAAADHEAGFSWPPSSG